MLKGDQPYLTMPALHFPDKARFRVGSFPEGTPTGSFLRSLVIHSLCHTPQGFINAGRLPVATILLGQTILQRALSNCVDPSVPLLRCIPYICTK